MSALPAQWDGFTGSWGFAPEGYQSYNGTPYVYTNILYYYSTYTGHEGWFPLASNFTFQKYAGYMYYYR